MRFIDLDAQRRRIEFKLQERISQVLLLLPLPHEHGTARAIQATRKKGINPAAIIAVDLFGIPAVSYCRTPLHRQPAYEHFPRDPDGLENAEMLPMTTLSLPIHPYPTPDDQRHAVDVILSVLSKDA